MGVVDERRPGKRRLCVGAEPLPRPLVERLTSLLQADELPELLPPTDVGLEQLGVLLPVERADVLLGSPAAFAPADTVDVAPVLQLPLFDHRFTSFRMSFLTASW